MKITIKKYTLPALAMKPYPRIEIVVEYVGEHIYYDEDRRACNDASHDHRIVSHYDALHGEAPYPVPSEYGLSHHSPAQVAAEVEPYNCYYWDKRIFQNMDSCYFHRDKPFCLCGPDIRQTHRLLDGCSRDPGKRR